MIDLHTHTNYSDGTWNLKKLLEEAEKTNIEILSITDHNTINSYKELEKINIKDIFKGKIIPGIEFSTVFDGVEVYHSSFTEEQIKFLEKYCKDNNLLMSGGSDCHGEKKTDRKIGVGYGNLNISKEILTRILCI